MQFKSVCRSQSNNDCKWWGGIIVWEGTDGGLWNPDLDGMLDSAVSTWLSWELCSPESPVRGFPS